MNKPLKQILAMVSALMLMFFWAGHVWAAEYGGIGGRPVNPDPAFANSSSWFMYSLLPGQLKEDAVEVQNNSVAAEDLVVYAADSTPSSDGGFALKQQAEKMTAVGSWLKFYPDAPPQPSVIGDEGIIGLCSLDPVRPPSTTKKTKLTAAETQALADWCIGKTTVEIHLESLTKTTVPFVVTIPANVDVGEHSGGIAIQKKAVERKEQGGSAVILTTRVGVRIYETVPGDIIRQLAISKFTVTRHPTRPEYTLVLGLKNTGNVSLENSSTIQIADTFFKRGNQTITRTMQALPGQELVINTDWPRPIFGRYRFIASATYKDGDQVHNLSATPIVIWVVPWREIIMVLAVILLGLLVWFGWRWWNRRNHHGRSWVHVETRSGDTIASLAEITGVGWKKIARMNKLKAPYHLKPGQHLHLFLPPSMVEHTKNSTASGSKSDKH